MSIGKIIAAVGAVALIGFGIWAARPLFVTERVNEALPEITESELEPTGELEATSEPMPTTGSPKVISEGSFTGFDAVHQASGTARLIEIGGKQYIRFENDFTVTNGPDLFVHLGNNNKYDASANLGSLKGNEGSQNYEIPANIDLSQYNEVWVWCRAFSVPFGKAVLQ